MTRRTTAIPARPDLPAPIAPPAPRRRGAPVAVLVAIALAAVPAVAAVVIGSRVQWRHVDPTPSPEVAAPSGDPAYGFLFLRADGGPVRWNPCRAIAYEVNLENAPDGALQLVEEAFARTTEVTGVRFRFVGVTHRTIEEQGDSFLDTLSETWEPVLIAWLPRREYRAAFERPNTDRHSLAVAYVRHGRTSETRQQYASGYIAVDADARMPPNFVGRYSLGMVLMHEAGHLMGLDHVKDPGELMFADRDAYPLPIDGWGEGDLEGLERLGEGGCLEPIRSSR